MLQEVFSYPHSQGVRTAMISSVAGASIATLSEDKKLRVFETETGAVKSVFDLEKELYSDRCPVNIEWHPRQEDLMFVATPNWKDEKRSGAIRAFSSEGTAYTPVTKRGKEFSWLPCSVVKCHPSRNILACGFDHGWVSIFDDFN